MTIQPASVKNLIKKAVLLALAILSLVWVGYILITPGLRPIVIYPYETAILSPDESTHDLGVIRTDDKASHTFYIYNTGGTHLRIHKVDPSCGCTVADLSQTVIAPGEFTKLHITLDTSIKLGKVKKAITIHSNDAKHPVKEIYLTGTVVHQMDGHAKINLEAKDPLVLFKGSCATCHMQKGIGRVGEDLFIADCAMCHGLQGEGKKDIAPKLVGLDWKNPKTLARLRGVIANGSPNTPQMPPFSKSKGGPLNDAEIDSLVNYLKFKTLVSNPVSSQ